MKLLIALCFLVSGLCYGYGDDYNTSCQINNPGCRSVRYQDNSGQSKTVNCYYDRLMQEYKCVER